MRAAPCATWHSRHGQSAHRSRRNELVRIVTLTAPFRNARERAGAFLSRHEIAGHENQALARFAHACSELGKQEI